MTTEEPRPLPPWLQAKVDQRIALMEEMVGGPGAFMATGASIVMTPLADPPPFTSIERWERTCDKCGQYSPAAFYTGFLVQEWKGLNVHMVYGLCPRCKSEDEQ